MKILLSPFVWVLNTFYQMTGSYGLALILFALVVKIILFPFQLKGKKSMIQMNMLSGQMQKLQKQYGKDRERYNAEVQKLYEREKVNPMGGCLWSFIPLFILLPLYSIIREPLVYLMNVDVNNLSAIADVLNWGQVAFDQNWIKTAGEAFNNGGYHQLYLSSLITPENMAAVQAVAGEGANIFPINFDFLGIFNLALVPQLKFWTISGGFALFLLPVISAVSGFIFSLISQKTNAVNKQSADAQNNPTMKTMLITMPLISLWIGFSMPAALCLYWIIQNLLSMVQEFICGKMLKKDYEEAAAKAAERERLEKEEEKERKRLAAEERARRIEEAKHAKGKKKKEILESMEKDNKDTAVISVSGIGLRSYARGRAYDPNRFSPDGPTPYHDPDRDWDNAKQAQDTQEEKKSLFGRKKKAEEPVQTPVVEEEKPVTPVEEPKISTPETPAVENESADDVAEAPYAPESEEETSPEDDSKEG
ncbi:MULTISPECIES: YidC/Oxa1 family membrane protein insertase [Eubacteriales]|uniref:YidC/Oxa1 family membrane protein insertase n=1 Tax=Eubacteriales TaxID=186802 RepID=UPI00189C3454|nr:MULTISPECIES: YidC/Oxa1 family membrane protein insertase [Eubacteriales]MBS5135967.1 membrane protein insertase YidC [Oscillospiraceae bacterium]MBT9685945.1 membrane protein insertase YidC [Pseudoflavonifractor sp. MCC625]